MIRVPAARSGALLRLGLHTHVQRIVVSMATPSAVLPAQLCVHAPTATELEHARQHLQQAGDLTAQQGEPPQLCALEFVTNEATSSSLAHCGTFSASHFFASLDTATLGRVLFTAAAVPSTQSVVQGNVTKLPDGLLFVSDRQLGGKGRGGNTWESPAGCLMFSTCRRMAIAGQRLPFVQYLVSLAVVQAVQAEAAAALGGGPVAPLDVRIKWPNDIYSGGLKVGGILCHSSFRDQRFHVIMGVGLNVTNRQPTTCVAALIEAEAARRGLPPPLPTSREALLAGIMTRLEPMLELLTAEGFAPFEQDYYAAWLHSGQHVELAEEAAAGGQAAAQLRVRVIIEGLSTHGYLQARDEGGEAYELHPDGNSLDFFEGLVRRKLPAE